MRYKMSVIPARDSSHKLEYTPQGVKLLSSATTGKAAETGSSKTFYHATIEWSQQQNILNMLLGMSCPSWQWHRIGYRWSPVRTLPVDLGRCPEQSWLESCGESPPKNKTAVLREQGKSCRDRQQQNILCDLPAPSCGWSAELKDSDSDSQCTSTNPSEAHRHGPDFQGN